MSSTSCTPTARSPPLPHAGAPEVSHVQRGHPRHDRVSGGSPFAGRFVQQRARVLIEIDRNQIGGSCGRRRRAGEHHEKRGRVVCRHDDASHMRSRLPAPGRIHQFTPAGSRGSARWRDRERRPADADRRDPVHRGAKLRGEREIHTGDRPEGDERQRPDPDRAVQVPVDARPAAPEVDRERAAPAADARPPDHEPRDTHDEQEHPADAVDETPGSVRQQIEVQILQEPDRGSIGELAEHPRADGIDQDGHELPSL